VRSGLRGCRSATGAAVPRMARCGRGCETRSGCRFAGVVDTREFWARKYRWSCRRCKPALVVRLRQRHVGRRKNVQDPGDGRRLHRERLCLVADTSLSDLRVVRELKQTLSSHAETDRIAASLTTHRTYEHRDPALVAGQRRGLALHRAGQADPERLHRELQRPATRRARARDTVHLARSRRASPSRSGAATTTRPYSALSILTPLAYTVRNAFVPQELGALRSTPGFALQAVATPGQTCPNDQRTLLTAG
jgi:hypothetical protein